MAADAPGRPADCGQRSSDVRAQGNEALVPETDRLALLRITPRKAAKPRVSTEGASAAKGGGRDPQATSRGASGESAAVSLPAR